MYIHRYPVYLYIYIYLRRASSSRRSSAAWGPPPSVKSISLKYKPSLEPLHISVPRSPPFRTSRLPTSVRRPSLHNPAIGKHKSAKPPTYTYIYLYVSIYLSIYLS